MSHDEKCRDLSKKLAEANFLLHQIWAMKKQDKKELPSKSSFIPAAGANTKVDAPHLRWTDSLRNPF